MNPGAQLVTSSPTLTFTPENWNTPQTVTVTAINDHSVEGAHTGTISHLATSTDPTYSNVQGASITVTVIDNDTPIVEFNSPISNIDETDTDGGTNTFEIEIPVTVSSTVDQDITVSYVVGMLSSATGSGTDYTLANGSVIISAEEESTTIPVTLVDDSSKELNETVIIRLQTVTGARLGKRNVHTITIVDDDSGFQPTNCDTIADNSANEEETEITSGQCIGAIVAHGNLSFSRVPATISLPSGFVSGSEQNIMSNPDGTNSDDNLIQIEDGRNQGGFELNLNTNGRFSDGTNEIPLDNLYVATSCPDGGCENGILYDYGDENVGEKNIEAPLHVESPNDPNAFTNSFGSGGLTLMDGANGTNSPTTGRITKTSQALNFKVVVPADQPAGTYTLTLTMDLIGS